MTRLETNIKQILLTHPDNATDSQILHDEQIGDFAQFFLVAEMRSIQRKTEITDLKKICEIILSTFRKNQKLTAEAMFENSLAEINQELGNLAHKGRSSWRSKFSAVLMLKSQQQIMLANTGAAVAFLKRKSELSGILQPEKQAITALKTFSNFSMGKVKEDDVVVLALNNIFNFISLDLFGRVLNQDLKASVTTFSKILNSSGSKEQFACFILQFTPQKDSQTEFAPNEEIFAPLPEEEMKADVGVRPHLRGVFKLFARAEARLPKPERGDGGQAVYPKNLFRLLRPLTQIFTSSQMRPLPIIKSWPHLSPARKFFLASFLIFILIFATNLAVYGFKAAGRNTAEKISQQITALSDVIHQSEAALIYKDDQQAFELLAQAWDQYRSLEKSAPKQSRDIQPVLLELDRRVNKITEIPNPKVATEFKFAPEFMARAGNGFLLAGSQANNISFFEKEARNIFLINNPSEDLRGIAHASGIGHILITKDKIYLISEAQKQVELLKTIKDADLYGVKFLSTRIYVLNKQSNQILRLNFSGRTLSEPQALLKTHVSLADITDFGLDKDIYLLSKNTITKVLGGLPQAFKLPALSRPIAQAFKISVASNLYILESEGKRLLILNKNGALVNQVIFPSLSDLKDFSVDEQQRIIYLLADNKFYTVTF